MFHPKRFTAKLAKTSRGLLSRNPLQVLASFACFA